MATDYTTKLQIAQENLERARKAYFNALNAQSWETRDGQSSRSVTNANLSALAKEYAKWQKTVDSLQALADGDFGGSAFRVGVKL
jgi:hypothetical protein